MHGLRLEAVADEARALIKGKRWGVSVHHGEVDLFHPTSRMLSNCDHQRRSQAVPSINGGHWTPRTFTPWASLSLPSQ